MSTPVAGFDPLYHNFAWLGLPTPQIEGIYADNQKAKAPIIAAYILLAMAKLRCRDHKTISVAELFCADGFYALLAAHFGAHRCVGYDNDRDGHLQTASLIRDRLGLYNVSFRKTDVQAIPADARFSIVANVGGLYHVTDPVAVLQQSYAMATDFLIVQNVVSLANESVDYFQQPAPGLDWGNRFSRQSFDALIRDTGWSVVDSAFNRLTANPRPEDQGSVYYLIEKN